MNSTITGTGCVNCFGSLGVSSRMEIYKFLKEKGKSSVTAIVKVVGLTQPTVSYHLKEMKQAGILSSKKVGKEVYYALSETCPISNNDCVLYRVDFPR